MSTRTWSRKKGARVPLTERLRNRIEHGPGDCWTWTGAKNPKGYGNIGVENRTRSVHRVAYETWVGPIPDGYDIDHICRNRSCINPAHLRPLTPFDNRERNQFTGVTHCVNGHPFDAENTHVSTRDGRTVRSCRTCNRERMARWRALRNG
jgi:hypothetical protein